MKAQIKTPISQQTIVVVLLSEFASRIVTAPPQAIQDVLPAIWSQSSLMVWSPAWGLPSWRSTTESYTLHETGLPKSESDHWRFFAGLQVALLKFTKSSQAKRCLSFGKPSRQWLAYNPALPMALLALSGRAESKMTQSFAILPLSEWKLQFQTDFEAVQIYLYFMVQVMLKKLRRCLSIHPWYSPGPRAVEAFQPGHPDPSRLGSWPRLQQVSRLLYLPGCS